MTSERGERLAAAGASLLVVGQVADFFDGGQMGVIATWVSGLAPLLPTRLLGRGLCGSVGFTGRGRCFGLGAEELLLTQAYFGLESSVLLFQIGNAQFGLVVHGLPVGSPPKGFEAFGEVRTNGARSVLGQDGGARAWLVGVSRDRQGQPSRSLG